MSQKPLINFDYLKGQSSPVRRRVKTKKKSEKIVATKRGTLYVTDREWILSRQKNLCAGKSCAKDHGRPVAVNNRNNFDHIKPLALGGKDIRSNIQALCANCHQKKTREDRKKIAIAKKEGKVKSSGSNRKTIPARRKPKKSSDDTPLWIPKFRY